MFCCLLCTSLSLFIDHPTKYIRRQQVEAVLLKALNAARDVVINPEIHKEIPDPIKVDIDQKGSASAGCIIPSPFGCICHASASYDVHLDTLYVSHERCRQCIQCAHRRLYPCGAIPFIYEYLDGARGNQKYPLSSSSTLCVVFFSSSYFGTIP